MVFGGSERASLHDIRGHHIRSPRPLLKKSWLAGRLMAWSEPISETAVQAYKHAYAKEDHHE
jgi:hypothetical protein